MKLLLLDSSSAAIEFAVFENEKETLRHELSKDENADALVYNMSKRCKEYEVRINEIDYVSVSNGPGSFTGLRIASAIAKAICFASDAKLVEVNSLDVLANRVETEKLIVPLIFSNSKTQEFYFSKFKRGSLLDRISPYEIGVLPGIINDEDFFVSNQRVEGYEDKILTFDSSGIISLYQLTLNYISQKKFSDYNTSEPFYMKEFVPLKSQKKLL
ncbi:MAG: tRNA (adenosine(37)-N6)-threonylcarbamoyltransferase complex dimerization subunit type 1 TsaB [Bacteroidetes bacterium]|nr:tRNA (adenosine(37)-N6)-threonylcarbamoyltransferase complex dimerization subunit type 1 TsaB [Bacteroidota bacterium]